MRIVFFIIIISANVSDVSDRLDDETGKLCNILCWAMSEIMHEDYSARSGFLHAYIQGLWLREYLATHVYWGAAVFLRELIILCY